VTDTFALTVNGQAIPIDQIHPVVDLGAYLHAGANTIVVRVATTYNNRRTSRAICEPCSSCRPPRRRPLARTPRAPVVVKSDSKIVPREE